MTIICVQEICLAVSNNKIFQGPVNRNPFFAFFHFQSSLKCFRVYYDDKESGNILVYYEPSSLEIQNLM